MDMEAVKNCPGYNLLLETRKWIDDIDKKVEKMRVERVQGIKDVNEKMDEYRREYIGEFKHTAEILDELKQRDAEFKELFVTLKMTIQGQEKILQALTDKVQNIDAELHNGLIPKKASEWFYQSVGKWFWGLIASNVALMIISVFGKYFK